MRDLPDPPFRAALMLPRWLGDAVMSSTLIKALIRLSGGPIEIWGPPAFLDLYSPGDQISVYRIYDASADHRGLAGLRRFRKEMDGNPPEALWVVPDSFSSALAARASGARIRVGRSLEGRALLLNHPLYGLRRGRDRHWAEEKADMLRPFLPEDELDGLVPFLSLYDEPEDFQRWLTKQGISSGKYIVYAPGALFGPAKRWKGFRELAGSLPEDMEIFLVGAEADREVVEPLERDLITDGRKTRSFLGELPLSRLARLFQSARFTISNDSGAMHLAAASGARVLGLFLSTDPVWTAPLGPKARFLEAPVQCRPCFKHECPLPEMICREALRGEDVIKAVEDWLEAP